MLLMWETTLLVRGFVPKHSTDVSDLGNDWWNSKLICMYIKVSFCFLQHDPASPHHLSLTCMFLQVISETFIRSSSQGLEGMFTKVLDFVPTHCRVLRDITCPGTRWEPGRVLAPVACLVLTPTGSSSCLCCTQHQVGLDVRTVYNNSISCDNTYSFKWKFFKKENGGGGVWGRGKKKQMGLALSQSSVKISTTSVKTDVKPDHHRQSSVNSYFLSARWSNVFM